MSVQRQRCSEKGDPVLPGQGGRLTPIDPMDPVHLPREELIRRKAYELYERRGKTDGYAVEDWLQAERQTRL
jgi:hypothetical protein